MKRLKKVLLGILIFIIVASACSVAVFQFYIKPKYSNVLMQTAKEFLESESNVEGILNSSELGQAIEGLDNSALKFNDDTGKADKVDKSPAPSLKEKEEASVWVVQDRGTIVNDKAQNTSENFGKQITENTQEPVSTTTPSKKSSGERLEEVKEHVAPKDMADGMRIVNKIDVGYLSGLASGGLTQEEKVEAYNYLRQNLSESEYQRFKELIYKYMYLLN